MFADQQGGQCVKAKYKEVGFRGSPELAGKDLHRLIPQSDLGMACFILSCSFINMEI